MRLASHYLLFELYLQLQWFTGAVKSDNINWKMFLLAFSVLSLSLLVRKKMHSNAKKMVHKSFGLPWTAHK